MKKGNCVKFSVVDPEWNIMDPDPGWNFLSSGSNQYYLSIFVNYKNKNTHLTFNNKEESTNSLAIFYFILQSYRIHTVQNSQD